MPKAMKGGDVFTNVADLAVPFGMLFALNAFKNQAKPKPKPKTKKQQKGGESSCLLCAAKGGSMTQDMIRTEISKITTDLKNLLEL